MFVPTARFPYTEALTPKMMVFGGWAFRRCTGPEEVPQDVPLWQADYFELKAPRP